MSKTIIYQCNHCAKQFSNTHEILEISSKDNSLGIINNSKGAKLRTLSLHSDLHFCSQNCLNEFLFHPLNSTEVILIELKRIKELFKDSEESDYSNEIFSKVIHFLGNRTTTKK